MDQARLLSIVGELYEAATDPARLGRVNGVVQRAMQVESCIVFAARPRTGELVQLVSASPNFDAQACADYCAYYHARNAWYQAAAKCEPPFVARGEEIVDYRDFEKTEFCVDWCSRVGIHHMIGGFTRVRDDMVAVCGIHAPRGAGAFDQGRKDLFSAIMQHLGRVFQMAEHFGVLRHGSAVSLRMLEALRVGFILIDQRCRPLLVNRVAERLLKASRWLSARAGRVRPVHPASVAEFERRVAAAPFSGEGLFQMRDPVDPSLPVLITRFRSRELAFDGDDAVALIFMDPDAGAMPAADTIAEIYGLTRAEGRLVAALARGSTLVAAARGNGISPNTAKSQLRSVFLKTGFERQADLIAAVLAHPLARLADG